MVCKRRANVGGMRKLRFLRELRFSEGFKNVNELTVCRLFLAHVSYDFLRALRYELFCEPVGLFKADSKDL